MKLYILEYQDGTPVIWVNGETPEIRVYHDSIVTSTHAKLAAKINGRPVLIKIHEDIDEIKKKIKNAGIWDCWLHTFPLPAGYSDTGRFI